MELEGFKVVHALPGRVRLKVAKFKGNPALARQAQGKARQGAGHHGRSRLNPEPGAS